jgi:hypothetical protein
MKIFISWSGETSRKVAVVLRDWLPSVIQSITPYVSSEDINKGVRWSSDISEQLNSTSFGIICLTPENLDAPWIHFEAGALSKAVDKSRVAPFLLGLKTSDVRGPLVQFQSTLFNREEVKKLVLSINESEENGLRLDEARLLSFFDVWWPRLEDSLSAIEVSVPKDKDQSHRATAGQRAEIMEEMLVLLRAQQKQLSDPQTLLPPEYLRHVMRSHGWSASGAASRDLYDRWRNIEEILDGFSDSDSFTGEQLKDLIRPLGKPINYMAHNQKLLGPSRVRREFLSSKVE